MAHVFADLVLETTTTTGTGALTLGGASAGYRTFAAAVGNGNTCFYALEASNGQKETGLGTVGSGTLARTTVIASSTGSALDLPAGIHYVGCTANSAAFDFAVENDPVPVLGGPLETNGHPIIIQDGTGVQKGMMGYASEFNGTYLTESTTGVYDPKSAAVLLRNGRAELRGGATQVFSLATPEHTQVYADPDGLLYGVAPPDPGWEVLDSDNGVYATGTGTSLGPWVKLTGLFVTTPEIVPVNERVDVGARVWLVNSTTHTGSIEVSFGLYDAEPIVTGDTHSVAANEIGWVNFSVSSNTFGALAAGIPIRAWVRRVSGDHNSFGISLDGLTNNHSMSVSVPATGATGGLTAVEDDPAPVLGGNLELHGFRILITDATDQFHGALGYSPTVQALFLSENTPGEYFEDKGGISFQNGVTSLHGSIAQIKSLVGVGNREVYADPDGNLFPVEPAPPTWSVEDTATAKILPSTTGGTGAWFQITGLNIATPQDVVAGNPVGATTRAYINNLSGQAGDLEFSWGIGAAQPTQPGAIIGVVPSQQGYVTANVYMDAAASWPAGTVVQAWVRAISAAGVSFSPWIDGTLGYAHSLIVEAVDTDSGLSDYAYKPGVAGGQTLIGGTGPADALTLQGTSGTGTATSTAWRVKTGNNGDLEALSVTNSGSLTTRLSAGIAVPNRQAKNAAGTVVLEERVDANNLFLGLNSGATLTTGVGNLAVGTNAQAAITEGTDNAAFGTGAQENLTTGSYNLAFGIGAQNGITSGSSNLAFGNGAQAFVTTGSYNLAIGPATQYALTEGQENIAIGTSAQQAITIGSFNTALGNYAQYSIINGSNNVVIGYDAGNYHADGVTALTDCENSIYIGAVAKGKNNSDVNSIVIGFGAIGLGANTTVIGNSSTTLTYLFGALQVSGFSGTGTRLVLANATGATSTATMSGDVTLNDTGVATIAADAVTYAKIQNVSVTDKILGRATAGSGNVEEITCTAAGRALLDDADATAQRSTLGLGTAATTNATAYATAAQGALADSAVQPEDITTGIRPVLLSYKEHVHTIIDGPAFEIDPNNGSIQVITLGASRSPLATNFAEGHSITMMINDGTAYAITWPSVVWVGGSPPTLASSGYAVINLWKVGTTLYGMSSGSVA